MSPTRLDLRGVAPTDRHPKMAAAFQRLPKGGAMELIDDRDPQPLKAQFQTERKGQFIWEDVEKSDTTWRVRIAKTGAEDCCGGCTCN